MCDHADREWFNLPFDRWHRTSCHGDIIDFSLCSPLEPPGFKVLFLLFNHAVALKAAAIAQPFQDFHEPDLTLKHKGDVSIGAETRNARDKRKYSFKAACHWGNARNSYICWVLQKWETNIRNLLTTGNRQPQTQMHSAYLKDWPICVSDNPLQPWWGIDRALLPGPCVRTA